LLLLNGCRVSEAVNADIDDLDTERGHRVLRIVRKGGRAAVLPLAPRTVTALEAAIGDRTTGPIFVGRGANRLGPRTAYYLVCRVARAAGIDKHLTPHSLRHGFVTLALEAGATLTDVQDAAGHADPRTTRRYDRARHRLDHAPTYTLDAALGGPS
jgi:integrase/recombinase XerD